MSVVLGLDINSPHLVCCQMGRSHVQQGKSPSTHISGGTSNQKLELSVAGASDPSARAQKIYR